MKFFKNAQIFSILLFSLNSWAHFPILSKGDSSYEQPFPISRPYHRSIAIYSQFESATDEDVYLFEVKEKDLASGEIRILIGTLVPACRPLKDLLISWTIFGPIQEAFNGANKLEVVNNEQGKMWYEPYTAHYYFYQKRKVLSLTEPGVYKIVVKPLDGVHGDYIFEFGDKEIWSFKDILSMLWIYPKLLMEGEIQTPNCTTSNEP